MTKTNNRNGSSAALTPGNTEEKGLIVRLKALSRRLLNVSMSTENGGSAALPLLQSNCLIHFRIRLTTDEFAKLSDLQ